MTVSVAEIEALRFHLGKGQLGPLSVVYAGNNYYEFFQGVIKDNLSDYASTTATATITSATTVEVTPVSMTDIVPYARLYVDVGDSLDVVQVKAVGASTFTASFAKAHTGTFPIQLECGVARLRQLLWSADKAFQAMQASTVTETAGIKQLGQGEIEWFDGTAVLEGKARHYQTIVEELAKLVMIDTGSSRGNVSTEAY